MRKNTPDQQKVGARPSGQTRLPHEHDESTDSQADGTGKERSVIKRAHDDIVSGKKDTDLHGTPGLDKPA